MLQEDDKRYHPHAPTDAAYLEAVRKSIPAKEVLEDIHFEYLNEVMEHLGIAEDPYSFVTLEKIDKEKGDALLEEAFTVINGKSLDSELARLLGRLWDYLAKTDSIAKADLAFVFGGPGDQRAHDAVALFKEGVVPKILFTGSKASYLPEQEVTEADYFAGIAKAQGVPEDALILEKDSRNTPENAVFSVRKLKEIGFLPKTIIAISLPYHMRRSYFTLKGIIDWDCSILCRPTRSAKYTCENYYRDKNGLTYVVYEYLKLYAARLMKHF